MFAPGWRCDHRAGDDAERSDAEERRMTTPVDKAALRREFERRKSRVKMDLDFIQCFNDGESVVIEALTDGETTDGVRYNSPTVFIFETRDGLITSLREYGDTQLAAQLFGP